MKIQLKNLSFSYQNNFIIKKANNTFNSGNIHFINGKNGSGKTTLLKLIATFLTPDFGDILYNEVNHKDFKKNKNILTYITHIPMLYPELTLKENFRFFDKIYSSKLDKAKDLRKDFNLMQFNDMQVKRFSRGMKQKASIALSLLFDYKIYLFDEPFSGLDMESQKILNNHIIELSKQEKLIIMISHHVNKMENSVYYSLKSGKIEIND
jgi:ABC-type multidrug transport system ATPase subunit